MNYTPPSDEARTLLVSNSLNWDRTDVVQDYMEFGGDNVTGIRITDGQGNEMPCQVIKAQNAGDDRADFAGFGYSRVDFAFLAKDVPSLGFKTFYLEPRVGASDQNTRRGTMEHVVENDHFRLDVTGGMVKSLQWKRPGGASVELAAEADHFFNEVVVLEDLRFDLEDSQDEQAMKGTHTDEALALQASGEDWLAGTNFTGREWRASDGPTQVQWVERGPVWTTVCLRSHVLGAPIVQEIRLHNQEPRVDLITSIDWNGTKNTQLRVALPYNVPEGEVTYEVPFANVVFGKDEIPNTYRGDGSRWVQKWLDVSNGDYGVTQGTSNCVHAIKGTSVYPTLLRTAYSCGTPFFRVSEHRHAYLPRHPRTARRRLAFGQRGAGRLAALESVADLKAGNGGSDADVCRQHVPQRSGELRAHRRAERGHHHHTGAPGPTGQLAAASL